LKGIGFTMEGSENNPVMYELMSELPWRPERFTKEEWIKEYAAARYGKAHPAVDTAWSILAGTIYNCPRGNIQQGTHESIFCCRPNLDNFQASSWSSMKNYYDPASTRAAAEAMLAAAEDFRGNNNFEYDLVDIVRQAVADRARVVYQHAIADYKAFDRQGFADNSRKFMQLLMLQDSLLATRPEFRVGTWIDYAKKAATNEDEEKLYEWNARVQITTWGPRTAANDGKLRDYAHKEWNGILRDFYYPRWEAFFKSLGDELNGGKREGIDYYAMEEPWTVARHHYNSHAEGDVIATARAVFTKAFE
ncbi:MAG: alpha-N-acetylglucosaminidase, partial [Muribaculaceae bacterium]|nr:alpha-N-acetylglucosaminidase [Muribaculaceae bacterium]